jgi:hypothetical protein
LAWKIFCGTKNECAASLEGISTMLKGEGAIYKQRPLMADSDSVNVLPYTTDLIDAIVDRLALLVPRTQPVADAVKARLAKRLSH